MIFSVDLDGEELDNAPAVKANVDCSSEQAWWKWRMTVSEGLVNEGKRDISWPFL